MRLPSLWRPTLNQRGFTLSELLVVIAIIGVLVSLLVPRGRDLEAFVRRFEQAFTHFEEGNVTASFAEFRGILHEIAGRVQASRELTPEEKELLFEQIDDLLDQLTASEGNPESSNPASRQ